uniref:Uncharacterized protein n=1 Tax=viral metagenome TaxID=1070528 RepID=A0A6C0IGU2_9ZZZZ
MSESFDFNIDNYSTQDLISVFKLNNNYELTDLDKKAKEITLSVVSSNKSSKYKYDLIEFIQKAQELLIKVKNDDNNIIIKKNINTTDTKDENDIPNDNVGKIINPISSNPVLQRHKIPSNTSNAYNTHVKTANYIFNTQFRDNYFNSLSDECSFTLPGVIKNVVSINLAGIQLPNVTNSVSALKETNQIYIYENTTDLNAIVKIPSGNYDATTFPPVLEKAINEQVIGYHPARFTVSINDYDYKLNITNSDHTFTMNILKKKSSPDVLFNCVNNAFKYTNKINVNLDLVDEKKQIKPSEFFMTLGYLMGFRQFEYSGAKSYKAESPYDDSLQDYMFFELDDYNDSQIESTFGVFPTCFISKNILAVIPITTPKYVSSFDNNANFIYKTREYTSPINLKKISIKLLSQQGCLIFLHAVDFSFVLQVTTLYDNILPYNPAT